MATINEILTKVNELMPHQYDDSVLVGWISDLEGKIVDDVFKTHELLDGEEHLIEFKRYDDEDVSSELLVPDRYSDLYKYYVMAMICFTNQETDRYTNEMIMFNSAYKSFADYWNRTHLPIAKPFLFHRRKSCFQKFK